MFKLPKAPDQPGTARDGRNWPDNFNDRLTAPLPTFRELFQMFRELGPRGDLGEAARIPVARPPALPRADAGQTMVTWVGHATYVIQIGGLTVLTDPVWSDKIPGVRPRVTPVGVPWESLPRIDAVVISHNHYDHLDTPTIRRVPRATPVLVPAKLAGWFRRRGFRDVTELDWWESREIAPAGSTAGGVRFDFVPAHHWSRRTLTDTNKSLWGGWVLTADDGTRIYFAGDTGYGHWFGQIADRYPGIDLALLPIGAYEPNWFMKPVHLNPEEAVQACLDVGARRMASMHWGTFVLSAEPLLEPVERATRAWEAAGRPRDDLWNMAVGETRIM
ncbi:L-ascorbate metabolism protein UlaG, beta-lactamase superfamily [Micromonospora pattaloongensis]|uniref:L-ascorbate metabolism protein UlaG, beta-lactamase superfamily n=1 Tax=Micromonospora pattaloongensis TaxID=405436 RepID=A0A1H3MR61_9ACTN|nr:MBL fold metallo-hydrolase [Micromonospora pattaloongensis]SDY79086.1 L-ascorbate metabolism protein UlaG, beta-lactamase superfamily [Micromonospora pattaloongensis]